MLSSLSKITKKKAPVTERILNQISIQSLCSVSYSWLKTLFSHSEAKWRILKQNTQITETCISKGYFGEGGYKTACHGTGKITVHLESNKYLKYVQNRTTDLISTISMLLLQFSQLYSPPFTFTLYISPVYTIILFICAVIPHNPDPFYHEDLKEVLNLNICIVMSTPVRPFYWQTVQYSILIIYNFHKFQVDSNHPINPILIYYLLSDFFAE